MNICNHFHTDYRAAGYWLRINPELHRESLFRSGYLKRKKKKKKKKGLPLSNCKQSGLRLSTFTRKTAAA